MNKNEVAVLSLGSSAITVVIGGKGAGGILSIKSLSKVNYDGFSGGEFIDLSQLPEVVFEALNQADGAGKNKIDRLYIGVPCDFMSCAVRDVNLAFPSERRITAKDLQDLYLSGCAHVSGIDTMVINYSPLYLETNGVKHDNIVGVKASKIVGKVSYILAKSYFIEIMDAIADTAGIAETKYLSEPLCQHLYFGADNKSSQTVIIDIGHITSSVVATQGRGIIGSQSFSGGGGFITLALMNELNLGYQAAETLKRQVTLTLKTADNERYIIDEKTAAVPSFKANAIIIDSLYSLAENAAKCIDRLPLETDERPKIYLSGGGVSYIRGAKVIFEQVIGAPIEIQKPRLPLYEKPHMSAALGLLSIAEEQEEMLKSGVFN